MPPQTLCNTAQERGIKSGIGMSKPPLTVCVVGGGFTGTAAAIACLSHLKAPFRLVMIEGTTALGRGLAYGSHHPLNLLNVRTRDLSIRAGQPGDFLNWAFRQLDQGENQAGLHEALAHTFLPRQLLGEYVRQRLFKSVGRRPDVGFTVVTAHCARRDPPKAGAIASSSTAPRACHC